VAFPKKHIPSLTAMDEADNDILLELLDVIITVARQIEEKHGLAE